MENKHKRFLSLLLALVMVLGMMPVGHVHAEEIAASSSNLAYQKNAIASDWESNTVFTAAKAVDGDRTSTDSRWATNANTDGEDRCIMIDLGSEQVIKRIEIYFERTDANQNIKAYEVKVSTDDSVWGNEDVANAPWETVYVYDKTETAAQHETIVLEQSKTARYVMLNVTDYDGGSNPEYHNVSVMEIEVYAPDYVMNIGDTATIEVDGDYSELSGNDVVSVNAQFAPQMTERTAALASSIEEGEEYVLVNTRLWKALETTTSGNNRLFCRETVANAPAWTIKAVEGVTNGYTVQTADGAYLVINSDGTTGTSADSQTLEITKVDGTDTWVLKQNGQYLCDFNNNNGGSALDAGGYGIYNDGGNKWLFYKVSDAPAYSWSLANNGEAVTSITADRKYVFEQKNTSTLLSNAWNNKGPGGDGTGAFLKLNGTKNSFTSLNVWNVTNSDTEGVFHVTDANGLYLRVNNGRADVTSTETNISIGRNINGSDKWQIGQVINADNTQYLNHWGGGSSTAVGGYGGVDDSNSQWNIYEVVGTPLGTTTITLAAQQAGDTTITVGDTTYSIFVKDPEVQVIARYTSNRLSWNAVDGVTYTVERSADGEDWAYQGTSTTGSYLDESAGLGTRYYYRLTIGDAHTDAVQGDVTGMAALRKNAVLFYKGEDKTVFDGTNKVTIAEGDKATELNSLESGTIIYKATFNNLDGYQAVLGTDNGRYVGSHNSLFRMETSNSLKGENGGGLRAGSVNIAGFVYDDSNGRWTLYANGGDVLTRDLDEANYGFLSDCGATTYYAGGGSNYGFNGTIDYIMVLSEALTDSELQAVTNANTDTTVQLLTEEEKTVLLSGTVTPEYEGLNNIAEVTATPVVAGKTGNDANFNAGTISLADCEYTFDQQDDGTYLVSAIVDGITVYVDPHAGASNNGYPNRTYKTYVTLENGTDGAFKFRQLNEGYLHFSGNVWNQCTNDGCAEHNLRIYRQVKQGEQSSDEIPGYIQVTSNGTEEISDGGKYLIVAESSSGCYAMRPCSTTTNKYQHLCKIDKDSTSTKLTIRGVTAGKGNIYAGENVIKVTVIERGPKDITLNYNDGVTANGTITCNAGEPIGELPIPMRQGYTFYGWMLNGTKVTPDYVVTVPITLTADWISVTKYEKPANGTATGERPFPETYPDGSPYNYRIPGLVTMADGTVVAMADARWNTEADSSGHDTIVSVSKDNGKTWEYTYANYLGDSNDVRDIWASMFIDPAIATDGETLYMIADLFPAGVSTQAAALRSQSGSNGFNADGKLMLRDLVGDTLKLRESGYLSMATSRSYDFYLDPNDDGSYTIRRESDDTAVEGYTVDKMFNIRSTDGTVDTHLFLADSPYQVYPTNYLYLTKSTDGLNWSEPELITAKNADESAFLIGPGSGTYDAANGRMIFTAYTHGGSLGERTCLLWAGEDGVWHRSEDVGFGSSEATAVVLDNGTVRVFYRTGGVDLRYTDYKWNGSEYVRDTDNTDVDTGVDRKNTCMLTAFKYPGKVNGREMILVAAPNPELGSTYERKDGRIYAFYVNKDGTMEHVATYNVAPDTEEWYGYSCLTVLNQGDETGDLALFWEDAWSNNPAACTIKYSVIPIEDVLAGVPEAPVVEVNLAVGETATFEDETGYYVGEITSELNTDVATVEITGDVTESVKGAGDAVSTIADGQYVIISLSAGKPVTNGSATYGSSATGLLLEGSRDNVPTNGFWNVETVTGGYKIQDVATEKYLTLESGNVSLTDEGTVVTIESSGGGWAIKNGSVYLNHYGGGSSTCASGYNTTNMGDGSRWLFCSAIDIPVNGTSSVTFTAQGAGDTSVLIGNTVYNITVSETVQNDVIRYANISMANDLKVHFAFPKSLADDWTGYYAEIVKDYADGRAPVTQIVEYSEWASRNINGDPYYYVTFNGVAAKEMTDNFTVTIYDPNDTAIGASYTDTIKSYALRVLNGNYSDAYKKVVVDMLNYGAEAQKALGYNNNEENLANYGLTDAQKAYGTTKDITLEKTEAKKTGSFNYKANVKMVSNIQFMMAFSNINPTMHAVVTFEKWDGTEKTLNIPGEKFVKSGNYYYLTIEETVIADGRQPINCKIYASDGTTVVAEVTDSIAWYASRTTNNPELYKAIVKFSDSALAYQKTK